MNKLISANFLKFIGVTFSSWECQYFCRVPILYNPKTFQRVPSNTSTRPRMNAILSLVTFPAKIREFGESRSFTWTFLFCHWFQFLLACENIRFSSLFAAGDVSPPQTFLPGVRNLNTDVSKRLLAKRPHRRRARRNGCFRRLSFFKIFFFQNVSRLKRFYQALEIWIQTWVGVRSKFLICRRDNHALGVTLCRYTNLNIVSLFGSKTAWGTTNHRHYST